MMEIKQQPQQNLLCAAPSHDQLRTKPKQQHKCQELAIPTYGTRAQRQDDNVHFCCVLVFFTFAPQLPIPITLPHPSPCFSTVLSIVRAYNYCTVLRRLKLSLFFSSPPFSLLICTDTSHFPHFLRTISVLHGVVVRTPSLFVSKLVTVRP